MEYDGMNGGVINQDGKLMISNDAIHVQVEERSKDGNVKSIDTSEVDDCLCVVHDVW
jgi:hypothetical protein